MTGTIFTVNAWRHDALEVPSEFSQLRFWRHTSVANMQEVVRIRLSFLMIFMAREK